MYTMPGSRLHRKPEGRPLEGSKPEVRLFPAVSLFRRICLSPSDGQPTKPLLPELPDGTDHASRAF